MIVAGIDPGRRGAVAIVELAPRRVLELAPLPLVLLARGLDVVDGQRLAELVARADLVAVELQAARSVGPDRNSPASAHTAGRLWGSLLLGLHLSGRPIELVAPSAWKGRNGIAGLEKQAAVGAARSAFGASFEAAAAAAAIRSAEVRLAAAEAALIALAGAART